MGSTRELKDDGGAPVVLLRVGLSLLIEPVCPGQGSVLQCHRGYTIGGGTVLLCVRVVAVWRGSGR